jgi:hypothetical protein
LGVSEETILMRLPTNQLPASQVLLLRAARARRIAAMLSLKDAEVVEAYARECEAAARQPVQRLAPQPLAA